MPSTAMEHPTAPCKTPMEETPYVMQGEIDANVWFEDVYRQLQIEIIYVSF